MINNFFLNFFSEFQQKDLQRKGPSGMYEDYLKTGRNFIEFSQNFVYNKPKKNFATIANSLKGKSDTLSQVSYP